MKKIDIALLIGLIFTIIFSNFKTFEENYNDIRNNVVRLHILANSDSEEDQALKLKVRDAVLTETKDLFSENSSYYDTEKTISNNLERIKNIAESTIRESGYKYSAKCELVNMEFDTRVYDNFTMPAGRYDALRITIGEAKGHNWWCVMYPPLCIPAATEKNIDEYKSIFSEEELEILKNPKKYKIKFKCVEWYNEIKKKLDNSFIDFN